MTGGVARCPLSREQTPNLEWTEIGCHDPDPDERCKIWGTTSTNVRYVELRMEAQRRVVQHSFGGMGSLKLQECVSRGSASRCSGSSAHPLVESETNTPGGRWLHELIDLVGNAHIGCRKAPPRRELSQACINQWQAPPPSPRTWAPASTTFGP